MAERKPLVIIDGQVQELPAGDTIPGTGGGGGSADFLGLTDTPNSYSGTANNLVAVKPDASGLEFLPITNAIGLNFAGFKVVKTATQALSANDFVRMNFESELFDTDGVIASSRFTVPATMNNKYAVMFAGAQYTANSTAAALYIRRSTDGGATFVNIAVSDFNGERHRTLMSGPILLTTGHMYEVWVFTSGAATITAAEANYFSMYIQDPAPVLVGAYLPMNRKTVSGSYTLLNTDLAGNVLITADTSGGACTITVPDTLTGTEAVLIERSGANNVTIAASGATTLRSADNLLKLRANFSMAGIVPKGSNVYTIVGDVAA